MLKLELKVENGVSCKKVVTATAYPAISKFGFY